MVIYKNIPPNESIDYDRTHDIELTIKNMNNVFKMGEILMKTAKNNEIKMAEVTEDLIDMQKKNDTL